MNTEVKKQSAIKKGFGPIIFFTGLVIALVVVLKVVFHM